jgi:hypothetical protein
MLPTVSACLLPLLLSSAASAHWGKTTITDGNGDGVQIQHHLLGQKDIRAQDMLGDGFVYKRGLFGMNKTEGASVLGNGIKIHHGLISGTSIEAQSMFGDKYDSHKVFGIGPRNTTVNLHGVTSVASSIFGHRMSSAGPGMGPGVGMNPAMNPGNFGTRPTETSGMRPEDATVNSGINPGLSQDANPGVRPSMVDANVFAGPPAGSH